MRAASLARSIHSGAVDDGEDGASNALLSAQPLDSWNNVTMSDDDIDDDELELVRASSCAIGAGGHAAGHLGLSNWHAEDEFEHGFQASDRCDSTGSPAPSIDTAASVSPIPSRSSSPVLGSDPTPKPSRLHGSQKSQRSSLTLRRRRRRHGCGTGGAALCVPGLVGMSRVVHGAQLCALMHEKGLNLRLLPMLRQHISPTDDALRRLLDAEPDCPRGEHAMRRRLHGLRGEPSVSDADIAECIVGLFKSALTSTASNKDARLFWDVERVAWLTLGPFAVFGQFDNQDAPRGAAMAEAGKNAATWRWRGALSRFGGDVPPSLLLPALLRNTGLVLFRWHCVAYKMLSCVVLPFEGCACALLLHPSL